jgi:membrane protein required for beta-lactamase induction
MSFLTALLVAFTGLILFGLACLLVWGLTVLARQIPGEARSHAQTPSADAERRKRAAAAAVAVSLALAQQQGIQDPTGQSS